MAQIDHDLFPMIQLGETEADIVVQCFSNPTIVRYLRSLGNNLVREYLLLDAVDLTDEALAKHHQYVKGQLALLDALCSIKAANQETQTN